MGQLLASLTTPHALLVLLLVWVCPDQAHASDPASLPAAAQDAGEQQREQPDTAEQKTAPRLVMVRRDGRDVPAPLREQVDQLVLRSVGMQVPSSAAYASDVPLDDIELAAGCGAGESDCMQRVSATLGADWLLVRELARDAAGNVFLTLIAHDGPEAMVSRRAVGQVGDARGERAAQVVPMLVERLYPTAGAEASGWQRPGASVANIVGWSAAGAGLALITVGIVMGALSRRSHRAYERSDFGTKENVDRAADLLSRSQQRARAANGLLIGGGVAAVTGAATLLWTYLRPRQDERSVRLDVVPSSAGAQLSFSGAWQGGL